jgi:hypothetical protein
MNWMDITIELLVNNYRKNSYILKTGIYQANVFGIRANTPANNKFDDIVGILRVNNGNIWEALLCDATTDPGFYYLEHPMNVKGTAILMPGQYIGSHKTGLHKGYRALVQCGKLRVWRDKDKDDNYDKEAPQDSNGDGIDIHHAGINSTEINNWSAACQVIAKMSEFDVFMSQVDEHIQQGYKDLFDYTLFEEKSL